MMSLGRGTQGFRMTVVLVLPLGCRSMSVRKGNGSVTYAAVNFQVRFHSEEGKEKGCTVMLPHEEIDVPCFIRL